MSSVDKFIKDTHKLYKVQTPLTPEKVRSLRYKLAMAEIQGEVTDEDVPLALDIILDGTGRTAGSLKTAAAASPLGASNIRNAGTCPRCSHGMTFAKLAESNEARFCVHCNVVIPV